MNKQCVVSVFDPNEAIASIISGDNDSLLRLSKILNDNNQRKKHQLQKDLLQKLHDDRSSSHFSRLNERQIDQNIRRFVEKLFCQSSKNLSHINSITFDSMFTQSTYDAWKEQFTTE